MSKKLAIITGASRGIGRETAKIIANNNIHVVIIARTLSSLEELHDEILIKNGSCTIVQADICDSNGIFELANEVKKRWGKLEYLISCAGYLHNLTPISHIDENELTKGFNINVFGIWRLIKNFESLLFRSHQGRALFLSPDLNTLNKNFWGGYSSSNSALNSLIKVWSAEISHTTTKANIFVPKPTKTALRKTAYPGENNKNLSEPNEVAYEILKVLKDNFYENGKTIFMK